MGAVEDVSKRFGRLANGADDIRNHAWFSKAYFNWAQVIICCCCCLCCFFFFVVIIMVSRPYSCPVGTRQEKQLVTRCILPIYRACRVLRCGCLPACSVCACAMA
eukprot:COSAG05_NODE_13117_length_441_cov_0.900585_1_plen_104_part_10